MVEKAIDRLLILEPISDERVMVLPWRVEKARLVNPPSVDPMSVDTFIVLPLSVETVKRFTFIVDATTLDTVILLPVRVEYPIKPLNRLEMDAVEKRSELPDMVEKTPAFA
jgi:hypothetical protein